MATDILFPEWKIWAQFLQETSGGLVKDALEQSHPIQVNIIWYYCSGENCLIRDMAVIKSKNRHKKLSPVSSVASTKERSIFAGTWDN